MSLPTGSPVEFTVHRTELKRELPPKDGKPAKAIVKLGLEAPDGEKGWAESFEDRAEGTWPQPGSKHTFTLEQPENPNWALKAKRPGRGGGRGRSPADTAAIQRQHSQEMAIRLFAVAEPLLEGRTAKTYLPIIKALTDWFEADIANGGKAK